MLTEKEKIDKLTLLGTELNHIQDLDIMMEKILTESRLFVNADAGSIYIMENDRLRFTYTQNDTLQQRLKPGEKLIYSTFSMPVDKKTLAGYVTLTGQPLNLDDVYSIDPASPFQFGRQFDETACYRTQSALTIPLTTPMGKTLGVLQVINARDPDGRAIPFSDRDVMVMMHFAGIASVTLERAQMTRALLLRMIKMAEMRDPKETGAHVNRVGGYAVELYEKWARRRDIPEDEIQKKRDLLRMAAMLHDVGKVGISDTILKKPGKLDEQEYEIMKHHSMMGARLFASSQSDFDDTAAAVALNHHEKWNGSGYPGYIDVTTGEPLPEYRRPDGRASGKAGEDIPVFGRIVALADVFDALSSIRVYKPAWDEAKVLETLEKDAGTHFDPELVEIFLGSLDVMRSIQQRYKDE
ncbi:MAG: HD domain-containing phosphohydrolase [Thermodesulfobacteriota bacterium]